MIHIFLRLSTHRGSCQSPHTNIKHCSEGGREDEVESLNFKAARRIVRESERGSSKVFFPRHAALQCNRERNLPLQPRQARCSSVRGCIDHAKCALQTGSIHTHIPTHTYTHRYSHTYIHTHKYMHTLTYIHTHTCTHIHTHTHT